MYMLLHSSIFVTIIINMRTDTITRDKSARGRPKDFDPELVLEKAMYAFWEYGFETTPMSVLTIAMGLSAPSIYATFGNKEQLFDKAVCLYASKFAVDIGAALNQETTAKAGVERCLRLLAKRFTEGQVKGCLIISGAVNCSLQGKSSQDILKQKRILSEAILTQRIEAGIKNGEVPASTKPNELAKFFASVIQGMSLQAQDGSSYSDLLAVVDNAMKAWPLH